MLTSLRISFLTASMCCFSVGSVMGSSIFWRG